MLRFAGPMALGATFIFVAPAVAQTPGADHQLEELVVTAQKRTESVQDVPLSVTAVSGETLAAAGARTATQITAQVPNLVVAMPYSESQPQFSLRGISVSDFSQNQQSPIALYVDEVYKGVGALQSLQIFDVERMEVLRGPQGTLYGKNATGGAISFFTRGPTFGADNGYVTLGVDEREGRYASAAIGHAIVDDVLAARIAATYEKSEGFVDELTPGLPDHNGFENWAVRGSLRYQPSETLDTVLRLTFNRSAAPGYAILAEGFDAQGVGFTGYDRAGLGRFETQQDIAGVQRVQGAGGSLSVNWDLTSGLRFTSISSFDRGSWLVLEDADGTPLDLLTALYYSKVSAAAQDLRIATTGSGPLKVVVGAYASRESVLSDNSIQLYYAVAGVGPSGQPECLETFLVGCRVENRFSQKKINASAYFNAEYALTEKLEVFGGLRYSHDELRIDSYAASLSYVDPATRRENTNALLLFAAPPLNEVNDSNVSGKIGAKYRLDEDVLAFASFSTGYRGSSINGQAFYSPAEVTVAKPETLRALEAGVKSEWYDRKLRVNATVFHYDYRNQQFLDVTPFNLQVLTNAPKAKVYGLEGEVTARVTPDVSATIGAGYTHGRYKDLTLRGVTLDGNRLIGTPTWTLNGAVDWVFHSGARADLTLHLDGVYTSKRYFDAFQQTAASQKGYGLVTARVSARIDDGAYVVSAWVKNLTDQRYSPFKLDLRGGLNFVYAHRGPPRTFGVELTRNF